MGVPKFYRWISERYPCLSEVVRDYQIPEFDNLYLDFNGVVHVCSHPEDGNPHFRITEEKIFRDIFHYIEVLFRMIRPRKVFFMAIDGVAPRAKMNQQRGRRFRSAREAEDLIRKALEAGEVLPTEKRFDSNCITPGTEFMVRLQEQLKYFISKKVTTDKMWEKVSVYLSGHETPGEGEHKIMDFIRYERSQPGYDPNTRHCLYGLDADLIMLGLASHDPHFSLLREEVRFGMKTSQKRSAAPEETTFHLLHLSLLREYLDFEFSKLKNTLPFKYDLEHIIDDWVLMGFLVGNDFIPHLPHVHIHEEALPLLWKTYMEVLPTLDGYLNEFGTLNLPRFQKYLIRLSQHDIDSFTEAQADEKWMQSKVAAKHVNDELGPEGQKLHRRREKQLQKFDGIPTANQFMTLMEIESEVVGSATTTTKNKVSSKYAEGESDGSEDNDVEEESELEEVSEEDDFDTEFRSHKDKYYMDKMELKATPAMLQDQAHGYVRAIQWILSYYFNGCPSWSWYYPHHYAPFMSDVRDFADMKMDFDYGKPFLPFQQLMAVLPAASKNLLPDAYKPLMCDESSPVIDYYPVKFDTDLNGKKQVWEAVVLIPFIEENRLLSAMESVEPQLKPDEVARNVHSPHLLYRKSAQSLGLYPSSMPGIFPDIVHNRSEETRLDKHHFVLSPKEIHHHLCDGVKLDVYYPGFPTMKHIKHTATLKKGHIKVFQQNSRWDNMLLTIVHEGEPDDKQIAESVLGKNIYVGWPHLFEAKCVKLTTDEVCYTLDSSVRGQRQVESHELCQDEAKVWVRAAKTITDTYYNRRGIIVGDTAILVYAQPVSGQRYVCSASGKISLEKQYLERSEPFLFQTCCTNISVQNQIFDEFHTVNQLFPVNAEVFMLGSPHYGAMGKVLAIDSEKNERIRIDFSILQEPDFSNIWRREKYLVTHYLPGNQIARRLAISTHMVSRITGTLFVTKGSPDLATNSRVNVGLNLKFTKRNEQIPGFTRRTEDGWQYSLDTQRDLGKYISTFPELFDYLSKHLDHDTFYDQDIFGDDSESRMKELDAFLKDLPCAKTPPSSCRSQELDKLVVKEIEQEGDRVRELNRKKKRHLKMLVRPHLIYRPLDAQSTVVPDASVTFHLYDRVVNIREGFSVPLGLRGTVCGLHPAEKEQDTFYAVLFDEEFEGGLTVGGCPGRGYRMPSYSLINISHGERREQEKSGYASKPTAVVKPQTAQRDFQDSWRSNRQQYEETRYTNNDRKNAEKQRQGNNNHSKHGRQEQQQDNKQQVDFTNVWQQLQAGMKFESAQPPQSGPSTSSVKSHQSQGQSQAPPPTSAPSLQQAAKVLHVSQLEAPVSNLGAATAPSAGGGTDEFSKLMKSLELSEKKQVNPPKPEVTTSSSSEADMQQAAQLRDSTAALCQMLKIGQPSSSKPEDQPPPSAEPASKPVYGKQLSVNDLFEGAKKKGASGAFMGLPPDVSQPPPGQYVMGGTSAANTSSQPQSPPQQQQQQQQQQQRHQKRSRVPELLQWCQAMGVAAPTYNTDRMPDGRFTAVVTLGNNLRYHSSKAKTEQQARESAAGNALMANSVKSGPPPPTSLPFGQGAEEGPRASFSASPNSAFTPVRPGGNPVFQPPVLMSMPPPHFMAAGFRQAQMGGGRGPPPPGYMQQGHGPWDPHPQQWGARNQWTPGWGGPQASGWMQPGQGRPNMGQGQPHYAGQIWNPNQQQFHPHGWAQQYPNNQGHHGNHYGRQGGQRRDSESDSMANDAAQSHHRPEPKQWYDSNHGDHSEPEEKIPPAPKTPIKNPFVPLQVEKKQKTPQRETRREPREQHTGDQSKESPPRTHFSSGVPSMNDIKPRTLEPAADNNSWGKPATETMPPAKWDNVTSPQASQQQSTGGHTPRRPKSRIAAKFGPC